MSAINCQKQYTLIVGSDYGVIVPDITSSTISYWNGGSSIPAGTIRIEYVLGAMQYTNNNVWYVNITALNGFFILYNNGASAIQFPSTTAGFSSQPACESANDGKFIELAHTGGTVGMRLDDSPYGDNQHGSPDPTFRLFRGP